MGRARYTNLRVPKGHTLVTYQTSTKCRGLENHLENPKLWTIAHKTAQKHKNDKSLVIPLKHLVSVMGLVNHLGNPKQWAIAHENGLKMQKW
jgi:hypothetical protein